MYEVWVSEDGHISKRARFRLLFDALRYIDGYQDQQSFAIRMPNGAWYRDPATGRSIFGHHRSREAAPETSDAVPQPVDEDEEITQPLTVGAAMRRSATGPIVCPPIREDEDTDVQWPPVGPHLNGSESDFDVNRTPA